MIIELPPFLKSLQKPWLVGIEEEIQRAVRLGADFDNRNGKYCICVYASGGGGTIIGRRIDKKRYLQFKKVLDVEFLQENGSNRESLDEFLSNFDISLEIGEKDYEREFHGRSLVHSEAYGLTQKTYTLLPEHHLTNHHLGVLKLGGWGNGAAKYGEYDDPTVHLFACTTSGARRNFLALLLHETGHSFKAYLEDKKPNEHKLLERAFKHIQANKDTTEEFAADFLYGKRSRFDYYTSSFGEFVPELYFLYITHGKLCKEFISTLSGNIKSAWDEAYEIMKASFNGIEYV